MKKYVVLLAVIVLTCVLAIAEDERFISSLSNCSSYSESGSVTASGMLIESKKQILGWKGNKCAYKESIKYSGIDTVINCNFTKSQINELTKVMRAYNFLHQYSGEEVDTSSIEAVQNNPVVRVWNKYLQDSSVCSYSDMGL